MKRGICLVVLVGLAVSGAAASGDEIVSKSRYAFPYGAVRIDANGNEVGDWFEPVGAAADNCGASLCYDNFESDGLFPGTPIDGAYGADCGGGGGRFFLGETECRNLVADDFVALGDCDTTEAGRIQFGWFWSVTGTGSSERCVVSISIYEDFDPTCTGPAVDGFLDGFLIDFGTLNSSVDDGYYTADIPFCASNILMTLPADGSGAIVIRYLTVDNLGIFVPATCAQSMLWSTDKPLNGSDQGPIQWNDANNDGALTPATDCFDFTAGTCPGNRGAMFSIFKKGIDTVTPKLRLKCANKASCAGGAQIKARIKFGFPNQLAAVEVDGSSVGNVQLNAKGNGKHIICPVTAGSHTVQVPSLNLTRNTVCP